MNIEFKQQKRSFISYQSYEIEYFLYGYWVLSNIN